MAYSADYTVGPNCILAIELLLQLGLTVNLPQAILQFKPTVEWAHKLIPQLSQLAPTVKLAEWDIYSWAQL